MSSCGIVLGLALAVLCGGLICGLLIWTSKNFTKKFKIAFHIIMIVAMFIFGYLFMAVGDNLCGMCQSCIEQGVCTKCKTTDGRCTKCNAAKDDEFDNVEEAQMYVTIDDGNGGLYVLMSKGSIAFDGDMYDIYVDDPALLHFKVSESDYPSGVCTMSGEERNAISDSISKYLSEHEVDTETREFIEGVLEWLNNIQAIEGAST